MFRGTLAPSTSEVALQYRTRTGAVLRVDGAVVGAFDREHDVVVLGAAERERALELEVELASLPTHQLPSGPGLRWTLLQRRARQRPARTLEVVPTPAPIVGARGTLPLVGHGHLDIAWLWTFAQGRRKAVRVFANALANAQRDPSFVFAQSQPQLYADLERTAPDLFARVVEAVHRGTIDPCVGALWVESDANLPSGESLLRQLLLGAAYVRERFGLETTVAWLPDSFGFANTIPQLLAHAGIRFFATTKLMWSDTNAWPHPQFVWHGPDGSMVLSAVFASYDGDATPARVAAARERGEPLILGYGDGGGGPTDPMLRAAVGLGRWTRMDEWFESLALRAHELPRVNGELYLEYHRGVYTTHHDVKARRFALEAGLDAAEEALAWCIAVRAPRASIAPIASDLARVWPIVLRSDFHDVITGTSIGEAYAELGADFDRADRIVERTLESVASILPRGAFAAAPQPVEPVYDDETWLFTNDRIVARVRSDGAVVELRTHDGASVITGANLMRAYRDRPRAWEAWNIDADYVKHPRRIVPEGAEAEGAALAVRLRIGRSRIVQHISLRAGEPYLRVDVEVAWNERATLLRVENWIAVDASFALFGTPHGTLARPTATTTSEQAARFEVPGQRFARVDGPTGGFAVLAKDTFGWDARDLDAGGVHLGHSLLRSTSWPDPGADRGEAQIAYALLPLAAGTGIGVVERLWREYAYAPRVRLFACEDPAVIVVAVKPAHDGDGVIVRVRECDGAARRLSLRCGGRAREVVASDGLERPVARDAVLEGEMILADLGAFEVRTFRVRF